MALVPPTPPAKAGLALQLAGETLWLTPDRALVWPRRRWVIIADPHFGKTAAFQRAGLGLPNGVDGDDLERLGQLVTTWDAEVVVVLGDFFHGVEALDPEGTFGLAFRAFCQRFAELSFAVVRGNHDRWALDFGGWGGHWRWLEAGERVEPWALYHYPPERPIPDALALAGHWHPVVKLRGPGGDRLRLAVFWSTANGLILPAFGGFTGGQPARPVPGDRLYAVAGDEVVALPPVPAAPAPQTRRARPSNAAVGKNRRRKPKA